MAGVTEELVFKFYLVVINLSGSSCLWFVAVALDSTASESYWRIKYKARGTEQAFSTWCLIPLVGGSSMIVCGGPLEGSADC